MTRVSAPGPVRPGGAAGVGAHPLPARLHARRLRQGRLQRGVFRVCSLLRSSPVMFSSGRATAGAVGVVSGVFFSGQWIADLLLWMGESPVGVVSDGQCWSVVGAEPCGIAFGRTFFGGAFADSPSFSGDSILGHSEISRCVQMAPDGAVPSIQSAGGWGRGGGRSGEGCWWSWRLRQMLKSHGCAD